MQEEAALAKENLDENHSDARYCFLNQDGQGKTMMNILNPDSGEGMGREGLMEPLNPNWLYREGVAW